MTAADESRVVWRHEVAAVGLALGAAYLEGMAAARSEPRAEGLREALDEFGPMTFGPGCEQYNHPVGCQCPYPVAVAERDRLRILAATPPAEGHHPKCIDHRHDDDKPCIGYLCALSYPEPLIATPPAEGLDVERLAETIRACRADKGYDITPDDAAYLAAEYERRAALAPEQPE